MTKYQFIQRLQNSTLTSWLWRYWQHRENGDTLILVFWENPGRGWSKILKNRRWGACETYKADGPQKWEKDND